MNGPRPDAFRAMQSPTAMDIRGMPIPIPSCDMFEVVPKQQHHSGKFRLYNCKKRKTREQVLAARKRNKANRKRK